MSLPGERTEVETWEYNFSPRTTSPRISFALIGPFQLDCSGVSPLEEPGRMGGRMQNGKWFHREI